MIYDYLFIGLIVFYLIGASSSLILNRNDRLCTYTAFISAAIAALIGIVFSISIIFGDIYKFDLPGSPFLAHGIFIDNLSAFFILVISIAVFAVSIYSIGYVREYFGKKNIGYLGLLYNLFILSMILV
ncbi:MAG TPA: hydrogenase 4 subunit B, partial [Candidatus Nanoarchaeia archaeon]|nr:hydrogenase 4 subunit B [Candidatus Nanoarchaeia archaeon]